MGEPQERALTRAATASKTRSSFASVRGRRPLRLLGEHVEHEEAGAPPPLVPEADTTVSSGGEEPLLATATLAAAFALPLPLPPLPLPRSFAAAAAIRSERAALLSLAAAAETETEGEGRMLQVLLLFPPPVPRCGVECPESGMEQEGGAEVFGASRGRAEVEAATPGCCCEGDVVVEVDASMSIPPLLAPRRCVAVVAVPIRHDAEPPSCVGKETRKPPPPPPRPLSPFVEFDVDASTTTLPSSPLGTGTGGGDEGRADLAAGLERPRYDHMRGTCACA